MSAYKLRRKIAWEAARLIYQRQETQYFRAKMRAARQLHPGAIQSSDLPENSEIRAQIRHFARMDQQQRDAETLRAQRTHAYHLMLKLRPFQPRLGGTALTGGAAPAEMIDIQLHADDPVEISQCLDADRQDYTLVDALAEGNGHSRPSPRGDGRAMDEPTAQIVVHGKFPVLLSIHPRRSAPAAGHREAAGRPRPQATLGQLRQILLQESDASELLDPPLLDPSPYLSPDRFGRYQSLLMPLETVQQPRSEHPEGDVLYHSLQVFELARERSPYDEEFLLAALLHDVGKGIDQRDPVGATLESLEGWVPERTLWLIEHLDDARAIQQHKIGVRAHRRLQASDDFDDLMLLAECDRLGRQPGVQVGDVPEAIDYLRQLEQMCED